MKPMNSPGVRVDPSYLDNATLPPTMLLTFDRDLSDAEADEFQQGIDAFYDWDRQAKAPWSMSIVESYGGSVWQSDRELVVHMQLGFLHSWVDMFVDLALKDSMKLYRGLGASLTAGPSDAVAPIGYELRALSGPRVDIHEPNREELEAEGLGQDGWRSSPSATVTFEETKGVWRSPTGFTIAFSRPVDEGVQEQLNNVARGWRTDHLAEEGFDPLATTVWSNNDTLTIGSAFLPGGDGDCEGWMLRLVVDMSDIFDTMTDHTVAVASIQRNPSGQGPD